VPLFYGKGGHRLRRAVRPLPRATSIETFTIVCLIDGMRHLIHEARDPFFSFRPAHSWRVVPLHHKHDAIYRSPGANFREHPFYEVQRIARALRSLTSARRKSGLALVTLLDVCERAEDDVCHLLGVRGTHRVGGALDLHYLAGPGALGHEAVGRHGDVLV